MRHASPTVRIRRRRRGTTRMGGETLRRARVVGRYADPARPNVDDGATGVECDLVLTIPNRISGGSYMVAVGDREDRATKKNAANSLS